MNIKFKNMFAAALAVVWAYTFVACDDNDNENLDDSSTQTALLQKANRQFVEKTVIPTYSGLADQCLELENALAAHDLDKACSKWMEARQYWEWSEAFLFGAASKYGIDPHIDTWPLDETALNNILNDKSIMADIENYVANFNAGLLGFHGLEYIIFRNGEKRTAVTADEMAYAKAVAADLTVSACHLEAAWAGIENISGEKRSILEEAEIEPEDNFGEYMIRAGQSGSLYRTIADGSLDILGGARTIIDEVAHTKIGKPFSGEDVAYIESPHAHNSIQDFHDNIVSVRNAYYGGLGATTPQEGSLADYFATHAATGHNAVVNALEKSLQAIDAMPKPFVSNFNHPKVAEAIAALETLDETFGTLENELKK